MSDEKDKTRADQVEACIDAVMQTHPGTTERAQAAYYEEVHQHLAPLARRLERELRAALDRIAKLEAGRDAANVRLHEVTVACATAEQERDALRAKSDLYDWLEKRFIGADFNWDGRGLSVLCFEIDKRMPVTKELSLCIDAAITAAKEA